LTNNHVQEEQMKDNIATNSEQRRWPVLVVTVAAQFMLIVDLAVVNVALPGIKHDLQADQRRVGGPVCRPGREGQSGSLTEAGRLPDDPRILGWCGLPSARTLARAARGD
jgi:hypothetical protein